MTEGKAELFEPHVILSSDSASHSFQVQKVQTYSGTLLIPFSICNGHLHHFLSPPAPAPPPPLSV